MSEDSDRSQHTKLSHDNDRSKGSVVGEFSDTTCIHSDLKKIGVNYRCILLLFCRFCLFL